MIAFDIHECKFLHFKKIPGNLILDVFKLNNFDSNSVPIAETFALIDSASGSFAKDGCGVDHNVGAYSETMAFSHRK